MDNRYRDYVGFPPLLRSGENDGKSFSDFYRASQIELLSALDNVLSQKAEDALSEFAAVKKAEVNFQTSLGNRKGQLGINLIGAFAERQNNAFGWQVRVYGAQQDGKGFNAGVFYRHITDIALFGANAFVDYENHKLGNFYRYSIGGEAQNQYGSFAANYYVPITDEKRKDGGVIFSRKGYDAKLRLNIPNAKFLKAAVDYYNFGNEHGAESDDGFRYGAEAHLIPGLRLGLFYDDGGEELGGEVSYIHTIGEVQQAQTANEQWTPDLFAAVSREHSQRIVSVNVDNSPSFISSGVNNVVRPAIAIVGTVNIPAGYAPPSASVSVSAPANFSVAVTGGVVLFTALANTPLGPTMATIFIRANVSTNATMFIITLNVSRPSPSFSYSGINVVRPTTATIGTVNIPDGYAPSSVSLTVSIPANTGFSVAAGSIVIATIAATSPLNIMTTISIDAISIYATALTISLNVSRASSRPSFQLSVNQAELGTTATIGMVNIPPGFFDNAPAINLLSSPGLTESRGELIWQPDMRGTTILSVAVSGTPSSQNTTLRITAAGYQVRASVDATLLARGSGRDLLFYTMNKILITLPPARTSRSFALTITQDLDDIRVSIIMDPSGILGGMMGVFVSFTNIRRGAIAYTITIVEFSEADEMTLYAKAVMPFDMPGFSPPLFPQMAELALAKNRLDTISIPPHLGFLRRKGFAAKPSPLIF